METSEIPKRMPAPVQLSNLPVQANFINGTLVEIKMPFGAMVGLFIKAWFAWLVASVFILLITGVILIIPFSILVALGHNVSGILKP